VFDTILGLPVHPLVVHATVVVVPTAAAVVAVAAVWPRFRRWAGFLPLLLSAAAVVLVPVSTSSGEALEHHLPPSALVEAHAHLADGLLLPVLILGLAALAVTWIYLKEQAREQPDGRLAPIVARIGGPGRPPLPVIAVIVLIAAVGSFGTLLQVARIGHSGAKAAWSDVAKEHPQDPAGDGN
jgi:hypothetical protein